MSNPWGVGEGEEEWDDDMMKKSKKKGQEIAAVNKCGKTLVLSCTGVTRDRVWIVDSIYFLLIYSRLMTTLYGSLTQTSFLSLLQSALAVSWQRILTREL
jgi:hypothetical protein